MNALVDHLWQSTLFTLGVALMAGLLRRESAGLRFALWLAASLKFLIPFGLLAEGVALLCKRLHAPELHAAPIRLVAEFVEPAVHRLKPIPHLAPHGPAWEAIVVGVWTLGAATLCMVWMSRWLRLRNLAREAGSEAGPSGARTRRSAAVIGPAVVGVFRPALILPLGLEQALSPDELDAVLAHEFSHIRRRDNLTAAMHALVQTLFWFHPFVWWIGGRLVAERERACDEAVVHAGCDRETYAQGIVKVCRLYLEPDRVLAMAVSRVDLHRRVERIMTLPDKAPLATHKAMLLGLAALLAITAPVVARLWSEPPIRAPMVRLMRAVAAATVHPPLGVTGEESPEGAPKATVRLERVRGLAARIDPAPQVAPAAKAVLQLSVSEPALPLAMPVSAEPEIAAPVRGERSPQPIELGIRVRSDDATVRSCRNLGPLPESRQTVSTEFDGRVRRFIDEAVLRGPDFGRVTPAMAKSLRQVLPNIEPALRTLSPAASVQLALYGVTGDDIYLVRHQAADSWSLVWVDDQGRIDGFLLCAGQVAR